MHTSFIDMCMSHSYEYFIYKHIYANIYIHDMYVYTYMIYTYTHDICLHA